MYDLKKVEKYILHEWLVAKYSNINKSELWRKRCWITASSWRLFAMFQPGARRCLDLFFILFVLVWVCCCCCCFWGFFLSLLLDSVVFLAVLQCSAIWVGGSQSSASWASVHITKTTLQSCTLETRSSAKLKTVQKTVVIVRTKPLHFGLGFGLSTLLLLVVFGGLSNRGQGLNSHENLDLPLKFLEPLLRSKTSWKAVEGKFLLQSLFFLFSGQIEVFGTFPQHWIY